MTNFGAVPDQVNRYLSASPVEIVAGHMNLLFWQKQPAADI